MISQDKLEFEEEHKARDSYNYNAYVFHLAMRRLILIIMVEERRLFRKIGLFRVRRK